MTGTLSTTAWARLRAYRASPTQILVGGLGSIILLGTLLLALPQAAASGQSIGWVNALFTATSAVCVTGLVVVDTATGFSGFGQVVLLVLFQVGGLGYMTAATFVALFLGRRMGLRNRLILQQATASPNMDGLLHLAVLTVKVTVVVEVVVAAALTLRFMDDMPLGTALWHGVFHGVSAFNNAGFALYSDSLNAYQGDLAVTLPVAVAVLIGGLGFLVLSDLTGWAQGKAVGLSVHTQLTLWGTLLVGGIGALGLFMLVGNTPDTDGTVWTRLSSALFNGFAARTSGFAVNDISTLAPAALFLLVLLMMIGGGAGSTAGGIKVTTFGVIMGSLWATIRGREQTTMFHRTIPVATVHKSFLLGFFGFALVSLVAWLILALEQGPFLPTLFEVASAVGTVGLSVGDGTGRSFCADFSDSGKLLLAVCMFVGRLGPLTIGIAVLRSESQQRYRLPTEKVLIG